MGVHTEGDGLVTVAQLLGYAGYVCPVGDGDTGKCVTQLMRVEILNAVPLAESLEVARRCLGIHHVRLALLRKDPLADTGSGLLVLVLAQELQYGRIDVDGPGLSTLRSVQVDALVGRVAKVAADRYRTGLEVDVFPLEGAALSPTDAGVDQQPEEYAPLQRLLFQAIKDAPDLLHGIRLHLVLNLSFAGLGARYFVHGILLDGIVEIGHLEKRVENRVHLDNRGMGPPLGLDGQQEGGDVRGGDVRHLQIPQGRIDMVVQVALEATTAVLGNRYSLGRHENRFPVLAQGEDLGGFAFLLKLLLLLLRAADDLAGVSLPLKLRSNLGKLPVNGPLAPAVRRIPALGELGAPPAPADLDLVEDLPRLCCPFDSRCHFASFTYSVSKTKAVLGFDSADRLFSEKRNRRKYSFPLFILCARYETGRCCTRTAGGALLLSSVRMMAVYIHPYQ